MCICEMLLSMNINDWHDFMPSRKQAHFGTNDQKDEFNYRKKVAQTMKQGIVNY